MQRSKRSRRSIRNGLGAGSPDPVRRRHPWPKGLAGWVMRWIDKRPEYKSVVLKGVLGEFEKAAYAAVRDSETEGPRKVRGMPIRLLPNQNQDRVGVGTTRTSGSVSIPPGRVHDAARLDR